MNNVEKVPNEDDGSKTVPPKGKKGSSNKTLIIVLVVIAALVILPGIALAAGTFWLSRGDNAEKLTENIIESASGNQVDIDRDNGSISVEGEDGSFSVGTSQELPKDFPGIVVLYDGQTIEATSSNSVDDQQSWYLTAVTNDSAQKVSEYFESRLGDWNKVSSSTYNQISNSSYEKDDYKISLTITSDEDDEKTRIIYTVVKSQ